ncbi:hypothetical protein EVAR_82269_1 [Eumeta japonica]|uniref:Uncharacterized protein n=1 Tax=Eumeta variegata TaxID=151549 RepID=A0A4C1W164_EUMVA|nr:hypothetical protein EVAR_82269_1 [Eumeta japonica]
MDGETTNSQGVCVGGYGLGTICADARNGDCHEPRRRAPRPALARLRTQRRMMCFVDGRATSARPLIGVLNSFRINHRCGGAPERYGEAGRARWLRVRRDYAYTPTMRIDCQK